MKEIDEMDDDELVEEYRETVEFRAIESECGQVTPHEIEFRKALEQEILDRMA
ncbi:hypothetical protein PNQ29_00580 [Halobacterium salinarum]|uniref:hypothetical protein n=1 Tax=Halobacterium salinarum TaxID=2242 RepID=UPI0025528252|nr:hypothetical protein [Halobacterium salinarum]MDL0118255.1 hypothetical protein [Halobacterium salinarum]